jgi:predicted component of type VI protein secretion system
MSFMCVFLYLDQAMALRLIVETSQESISSYVYHFDQPTVTVGRSLQCDVQLPFPTISGHHLTVTRDAQGYHLREEGSTNGASLNQAPMEPARLYRLRSGDSVSLLGATLHVQLLEAEESSLTTTGRSGELARQMISAWLREQDQSIDAASLEVLEGRDQGARQPLPLQGRLEIGPQGQWSLSDPLLAQHTLVVTSGRQGYQITAPCPLQWHLDQEPQPCGRPVALRSGQRLRLGRTTLLYLDPLQRHLDALEGEAPAPEAPSRATATPQAPARGAWVDLLIAAVAILFGLGALGLLVWFFLGS